MINDRANSSRSKHISLLGSTGLALVLMAAQAQAQCTSSGALGAGSAFGLLDFGRTSSGTVSAVQSITSVLNTTNTAFLSQTSAFIGAPGNPSEGLNGGGVWARGVGGTMDTRTPGNYNFSNVLATGSGSCTTRSFQDYAGFQAGADISRLNINGGNAHFGLLVGYTESQISSPTGGAGRLTGSFQTPFVGVYGAYTKDTFYADGQIRLDFLQGQLSDPTNSGIFGQQINGRSLSFSGNIGKQFAFGDNWFVEPSLGGVYSRASVDRFNLAGTFIFANIPGGLAAPSSIKIEDFDSILGRASLRVGKTFVVDGSVIQPFVTGSVFNEFAGRVRTSIVSSFDPFGQVFLQLPANSLNVLDTRARVTSGRIGTYGQISGGIAGQVGSTGWLAYLRGDYRFGDRVDGYGISGGLRYQFTPDAVTRALITKGDAPALVPVLDQPVVWTGLSIGGSVGGLIDVAQQVPGFSRVSDFDTVPVNPRAAGILAGGQVGADYQFDRFVVGVAGNGDWANAAGGRSCKTPIGYFFGCESKVDALYMATARVGYALDRTLFYVKGGYAAADLTDTLRDNTRGQVLIGQSASGLVTFNQYSPVRYNSDGWTIGAGFEYALTRNLTAKAEYMHYELTPKNGSYRPSMTRFDSIPVNVEHTGDLVRVGVNYRFVFEPVIAQAAPTPIIAKN